MKKSAFLDIDKELLNNEDDENVLNEITSNDKEVKSKILKYLPKKNIKHIENWFQFSII